MIIERVEIENFGPYYGTQSIDLGSGASPLVVVHGANMSGKTSLLNAVRWCLYGVAKDRAGRAIPTRLLINDDAYEEGQRRVSVRLRIRAGANGQEAEYTLRRQRQPKAGIGAPDSDDEFDEILDIDRGGVVLSPTDFADQVTALIPEDISRFFLFDGELLNEYETLVREGGEREADAVKESIEMILGLPATTKGRDDLRDLKAELTKRLRREAAKDKKAEAAGEELERLSARKAQLDRDHEDVQGQIREARAGLLRLDESLKRYEESREDAGRKEELEKRLLDLKKRKESLFEQRRGLNTVLWRDVLAPRLKRETVRLDKEWARRAQSQQQLHQAQRKLAELTRSIDEGICPACGQEIEQAVKAKTRAEIAELKERAEKLAAETDVERLQVLQGVLSKLREVAPAGKAEAVKVLEDDIDGTNIDIYKTEQEIKKVERRLGSIDTAELREYDLQAKKLRSHLGVLESNLRAIVVDLEQNAVDTEKCRRTILDHEGPVYKRLQTEMDLIEGLENLFERAVDRLTDELRVEVEKQASEIFRELTTDKSYSGLQINERYGLTILKEGGEALNVRSAGAEQVVALSLLGALNRLATKRGPVIMDTPFGRLDPKHRANILRFVPRMADQVVLLVHGGEVDRERDLAGVVTQIDAEYEIHHSSATRSELVPIRAVAHA